MTDTVTAHHDYEAQQDDELSFQAGDLITVTEHSNTDWWMGTKQKDGTSGFFPSNFVEAVQDEAGQQDKEKPVHTVASVNNEEVSTEETPTQEPELEPQPQPQPQSIGMARVMEDYAMQQGDELTLHKGGIVALYEKQEDGWLVGEINGKQGRFPAKYVEEIDMPGGRPDLGKETSSNDSVPGGFKLAAFGVKQGGIGSLLAGGIPTLKKTVKSPAKDDGSTTSPAATTSLPVATPPTVTTSPVTPPDAVKPSEKEESSANKPLAKAIVLHPYNAENDDELNLIRGEYIDILDRQADDGWWQGRNEKNQLGVFPSNFVKEIDELHQAPPPPIRSRQSVAATGSSPIVPSESRPFSTPTPSLDSHTRTPAAIQRLPPLPDTAETTKVDDKNSSDEDLASLEFKGTPVGDLAPDQINTPPGQVSPDENALESPEKKSESPAKEVESPVVPVPDIALLDQQEPVAKDEEPEHQGSATTTEPKKEEEEEKEDTKPTAISAESPQEQQQDTTKEAIVEESSIEEVSTPVETVSAPVETVSAPVEEVSTPVEKVSTPVEEASVHVEEASVHVEEASVHVEEASVHVEEASAPVEETSAPVEEVSTPVDEVSTPVDESLVDETTDSPDKKSMGLPLPTTGPRLVSPNRTGRPSNRVGIRRPPTAHKDDTPSQTKLLQQELEKTPEEPATTVESPSSPSSPPPKPIKPIFAKFPTPFAMGGEGLPTKNLKPVQRRMFEPAPAHEPTSPPTNDDTNDRPATGGVRGLASRFAGLPGTGGGNEVMETKLKNFTKNEVEKVRKELAEERARVDSLEALIKTLQAQVEQLQQTPIA